jgi:hypothetical protein
MKAKYSEGDERAVRIAKLICLCGHQNLVHHSRIIRAPESATYTISLVAEKGCNVKNCPCGGFVWDLQEGL